MEYLLEQNLFNYLVIHCPDVLIRLQEAGNVSGYLRSKVAGISPLLDQFLQEEYPPPEIETMCTELLISEYRPSKYEYLRNLLQQDFESAYERLRENGMLTYEIIGMIRHCTPVFEHFGFSEQTMDDRMLAYAIVERVGDYLTGSSVTDKL